MAYDEGLQARVDELTESWQLSTKRMFGGLAYFSEGGMCFAIGDDEMLIKTGNDQIKQELLQQPGIRQATMGKRTMHNWVFARDEAIADDDKLRKLLRVGRAGADSEQ